MKQISCLRLAVVFFGALQTAVVGGEATFEVRRFGAVAILTMRGSARAGSSPRPMQLGKQSGWICRGANRGSLSTGVLHGMLFSLRFPIRIWALGLCCDSTRSTVAVGRGLTASQSASA